MEVFSSVHTFGLRRIGVHQALLSHFPYEGEGSDRTDRYLQWRLRDEGSWLIHGHVHGAWRVKGRQISVGFDRWPEPASAEELVSIIDLARTESGGLSVA